MIKLYEVGDIIKFSKEALDTYERGDGIIPDFPMPEGHRFKTLRIYEKSILGDLCAPTHTYQWWTGTVISVPSLEGV